MDASTRPPQKRHRSASNLAAALVAILFSTTQFSFASITEHAPLPAPDILLNTESSAHVISIATVKSGSEGLELSAKFTEQSQETVTDVAWTIQSESGDKVFEGVTSIADATLPPGDYRVTARYGTAQILQGVTVHEGTKLSVSFILNAGGLRVLPRIKNLSVQSIPSLSKIFALSGPMRGQLIATSRIPGEVLKVSAGDYRIESRFENGNALAVTDVNVRPGIMSAVNIDHIAGLAKLNMKGAASEAQWIVKDQDGQALPVIFETTSDVVLKPGHYTAQAQFGGEICNADFDIEAGQTANVILGN